jgi:hypothetical protein
MKEMSLDNFLHAGKNHSSLVRNARAVTNIKLWCTHVRLTAEHIHVLLNVLLLTASETITFDANKLVLNVDATVGKTEEHQEHKYEAPRRDESIFASTKKLTRMAYER